MEINLQQVLPQRANKELTTLEVGFLTQTDNEIAQAFAGEKIKDISQKQLKQNLAYIFQLIGLTRLPEAEEFMIIEDYIRSTYGFFSINEFVNAFKLGVQGKIECNIEHYERFSPKYISQIINSYKQKANEVRKMMPKQEQEAPVPRLTDDEIVQFTIDEWNNSDKNDFNRVFNSLKVFDILFNKGKLRFNDKAKNEIISMVHKDNEYRLNKMTFVESREFRKKIQDPNFVDQQCKKMAIVMYAESLSS